MTSFPGFKERGEGLFVFEGERREREREFFFFFVFRVCPSAAAGVRIPALGGGVKSDGGDEGGDFPPFLVFPASFCSSCWNPARASPASRTILAVM